MPGDTAAAASATFDDKGWQSVDLPHDWSVKGRLDPDNASCAGYLPGGTGWYRKTLDIPSGDKGKKDIHLLRGRLQPQRGVPKRPPFRQTSQRLHLVHVRRHALCALRRRERGCRARGPQPQRRLPLVHRLGNIPQRVARESRPAAHSAMGRVCLAKRSKHAAGNAQCRD